MHNENYQMNESPYQVMPYLSTEEYEMLKADIAENGVLIPIELDADGNILDGHHRRKACMELGVDCPYITRTELATDEEKRAHARRINLARRHLTSAQKRDAIADQLRDTPQKSDRAIGRELGVSHPTVASERERLEKSGKIYHFSEREDPRTGNLSQPAAKAPSLAVVESGPKVDAPFGASSVESLPKTDQSSLNETEEEICDRNACTGFCITLRSAIENTSAMALNSGFDRIDGWEDSDVFKIYYPDGFDKFDIELFEKGAERVIQLLKRKQG